METAATAERDTEVACREGVVVAADLAVGADEPAARDGLPAPGINDFVRKRKRRRVAGGSTEGDKSASTAAPKGTRQRRLRPCTTSTSGLKPGRKAGPQQQQHLGDGIDATPTRRNPRPVERAPILKRRRPERTDSESLRDHAKSSAASSASDNRPPRRATLYRSTKNTKPEPAMDHAKLKQQTSHQPLQLRRKRQRRLASSSLDELAHTRRNARRKEQQLVTDSLKMVSSLDLDLDLNLEHEGELEQEIEQAQQVERTKSNSKKRMRPAHSDEKDEDTGDVCGICFDTIEERGVMDSCEHMFCYECIDRWLDRSCRCPHCKRMVTTLTSDKSSKGKAVVQRELKETLEHEDEDSDEDMHELLDHFSMMARTLGIQVNFVHQTMPSPPATRNQLVNPHRYGLGMPFGMTNQHLPNHAVVSAIMRHRLGDFSPVRTPLTLWQQQQQHHRPGLPLDVQRVTAVPAPMQLQTFPAPVGLLMSRTVNHTPLLVTLLAQMQRYGLMQGQNYPM